MIKKISHLGVVVRNIEEAGRFYSSSFGGTVSAPIKVGDSKLSMAEVGNVMVELFEPVEEGILADFLRKRGEGLHHVCFEVGDLDSEIESLRAKGVEIIGIPREGIEGRIIFLHPKSTHGLLVELVQKKTE